MEKSNAADLQRAIRRTPSHKGVRREGVIVGWLFVAPALIAYSLFVLLPLVLSVGYSFYEWDGIGPATWVGLDNYVKVFTDPDLQGAIANAFKLIVFFSFIPVSLGLIAASLIRRSETGFFGALSRTVLFLPQVIPLVAAGIIWYWMYAQTGTVNQLFSAIGLSDITRAWLGDFDWAIVAVGFIGVWVLLGLCTILLVTAMSKIDPNLYEAARIDGAGALSELRHITLPGVRYEIIVCLTVTIIQALRSFDVVFIATKGGPGFSTMVPGLKIYVLAFTARDVGVASALAIVLIGLVLVIVMPLQRLSRGGEE